MNPRPGPGVCAALVAVVLLAPLHAALASGRLTMVVAPGDAAPEINAQAIEGWKFHSDWSQAAYTVLNFWATWCEPCRGEIPILQELQTKYKSQKLAVLGGLIDTATDDEARAFLSGLGVTYRVIRIPPEIANDWGGLNVLPTTYVINQKGKVIKRYVGATPEQITRMKADIEGFFAAPTPAAPAPPGKGD